MSLDAVFLDAGGVIVDPNWERVATVLRGHGVTADAASLAAAEPAAKRELDVPYRIQTTDDRTRCGFYWELVASHAGVRAEREQLDRAWADLDAYHTAWNLWEVVPSGVPDALTRLRAMGLPVIIVSNSNGTLRAKLARLGLDRHIDVVIDSDEVGIEKPDRRIFEIALTHTGAAADRVVHVGDLYEVDVVGARAAGIRGILVDPADLHRDRECPRVPSLAAFADAVESGAL